jgi:hypothetical protein
VKFLFSALLIVPSFAFAAEKPSYKKPVPEKICISAQELDARTSSCNDNGIFMKAADDCAAKVKAIHEKVTKEYKAAISKNGTGGQDVDFASSKSDNAEAVLAHDYMLKVSTQALDELDKYFDYVVQPDDVDSDDEILNTPCYHDAVVPMDGIAEQMENKIEEMKASKGMEFSMGKTSGSRETNTGSLAAPPASNTKGAGSGSKKIQGGASPKKSNTITGVEEDKKKRSK